LPGKKCCLDPSTTRRLKDADAAVGMTGWRKSRSRSGGGGGGGGGGGRESLTPERVGYSGEVEWVLCPVECGIHIGGEDDYNLRVCLEVRR
jgi:hypothetical protein